MVCCAFLCIGTIMPEVLHKVRTSVFAGSDSGKPAVIYSWGQTLSWTSFRALRIGTSSWMTPCSLRMLHFSLVSFEGWAGNLLHTSGKIPWDFRSGMNCAPNGQPIKGWVFLVLLVVFICLNPSSSSESSEKCPTAERKPQLCLAVLRPYRGNRGTDPWKASETLR